MQWLVNIREGISKPDEAITSIEEFIKHCQSIQPGSPEVTVEIEKALEQPYAIPEPVPPANPNKDITNELYKINNTLEAAVDIWKELLRITQQN